MNCFHPQCAGPTRVTNDWTSAAAAMEQAGAISTGDRRRVPEVMRGVGAPGVPASPVWPSAAFKRRILAACPCLFTQVEEDVTADAVVHLCEVTIGGPVDSSTVHQAFLVQHPGKGRSYAFPPLKGPRSGGGIMEALCSEVLASAGLPRMQAAADGWPDWAPRSHLMLNQGTAARLKLYGDILIPAMPHNVLISVKSEQARERLVVSGNRLESVGFGFFTSPGEFWSRSRIAMYKRWGFTAIYMPQTTLDAVSDKLRAENREDEAVSINGTPLYRPLPEFGPDMVRIAGRISLDL